jgi:very-short-patch-repair endonuclease
MRWVAAGRLHRRYPGVYVFGHPYLSVEGELMAAVLAAGREAVLSHATAAWWWGLIDEQPPMIELSVPRRCRPRVEGIKIHRPRHLERTHHRRLPVTPLVQTIVDYAARASVKQVKRALAQAEYHHAFELELLEPAMAQGRPGTKTVRRALSAHQPELARTRSMLEADFLELCQAAGLPTPQINVMLHGYLIDALWPDRRVVVELDGLAGHRTRAQLESDHQRDLMLRAHGYTVLRYSHDQVTRRPREVAADLRRALGGG